MTQDEISEALKTLVELQQQTECMFSTARALLRRAANEQAEAMRRAEVVNLKVYTESEEAAELKVSESTLRRHRNQYGADWPRMRVGSRVLYTNSHLVEIAALLNARPEESKRKAAEIAARRRP